MIRDRYTCGLALLGALLLCAFAAQGASAAFEPSTNTTAFTCVYEGPERGDFEDEHCDHNVGPEAGDYGHELIPLNQTTEGETTATSTAVLHATPAGLNITITATTGHGTGWLENIEPSAGVHRVIGSGRSEYTGLKAEGSIKKCKVAEPIEVEADFESVEDPESGTMGGRFSEVEGAGAFTTITLEGCALAGTYPIVGNAVATGAGEGKGSGATSVLEAADEELTFFGGPAQFLVTTTPISSSGIPGALTTVT